MPLRGKSCRCAVLLPVALVLAGPSAAQAVEPNPRAVLLTGQAALDVNNALRGALRKVENPACRQLLDEYTDTEGRPLREHLGDASPAQHLARLLIRDGEIPKGSRRCASPGAAAFTSGGAAVFVCGTNFQTRAGASAKTRSSTRCFTRSACARTPRAGTHRLPPRSAGASSSGAGADRVDFSVVPSRAVACLLFVSSLAGPAGSGQAPAGRIAPSAPRVTSRMVEVSVVAEDNQGRPVVDLTAEELALTDGGRPERIVSFSLHPEVPAAPAALPPGTFTNRLDQLAGGAPSVTAILFDGLNTPMARQSYARKQVLSFLKHVEPGNAVALYTLGHCLSVLHELTRDPRPLVAALERYRGEVATETETAPLDLEDAGLERFGSWLDELGTNLIEHYSRDRTRRTFRALAAIANHLEKVPGRKSLVWVSGSFPVWLGRERIPLVRQSSSGEQDLWPEIDRLACALDRASLAVYPVDARGLMAPAEYQPERASISREMPLVSRSGFAAMDTLAERTGGRAFYNDNDLGRAFRAAVEDSGAAYRLGYEPSHDEWDGEFREIRIAVKRPGVRLRHRTGYFAQPDEPAEDWYRSGVLGAAMWNPTSATGLGMTVRPFPAAPDTLDVDIRIDARDVSLQQAGERWRGQLDVWIVQLGKDDAHLGTVSRVAGLDLDRAAHEKLVQSAELPLFERLKRDPKAVLLRVLARDVATGALGSVSIPLDRVSPGAR